MSARSGGTLLWLVRSPACPSGELFVGTEAAVIAFISARHRATGLPHAAREVRS